MAALRGGRISDGRGRDDDDDDALWLLRVFAITGSPGTGFPANLSIRITVSILLVMVIRVVSPTVEDPRDDRNDPVRRDGGLQETVPSPTQHHHDSSSTTNDQRRTILSLVGNSHQPIHSRLGLVFAYQ